MIGENRVICFTPEQEFFAKGSHGIAGKHPIPSLGPNDKNDFITKLFEQARSNIAEENEAFAPIRAQYEAADARKLISIGLRQKLQVLTILNCNTS